MDRGGKGGPLSLGQKARLCVLLWEALSTSGWIAITLSEVLPWRPEARVTCWSADNRNPLNLLLNPVATGPPSGKPR